MPESSELLTPKEVAARLRVSVETVLLWVRSRKIPSVQIAGTIRIPARILIADPCSDCQWRKKRT